MTGAVEVPLEGGKVGGAVLVGDTVRRPVGPWTPAVHALLEHLAPRLPHVPQVLGFDERGREVLSYLPGRVIDVRTEVLTLAQIASLTAWTRAFHGAVAGFHHPGPWRYFHLEGATMIGHNDIAPFNSCYDGDELVGVFDWDMAGPSTPLYELAFIAWTCVPLWEDVGAELAAQRLTAIADGYGVFSAREILGAVPGRIRAMFDGMPAAAAAGDHGVANLIRNGQKGAYAKLENLVARVPEVDRLLAG